MKYLWKLAGTSGIIFGLGSGSPVAAQGITCHLGAQAGAEIATSSISNAGGSIDGLGARSRSPDFGLHTGCDYKIPTTAFSVGVWAEYLWRDVTFKAESVAPIGTLTAGLGNAWGGGLRAGYTLTNGVMPYALVGMTQTNLTIPTGVDISSSLKGWMLGGGVEVPLAKNLSLVGEARWTKYDKVDLTPVGLPADLKMDALSAMARFNFNLN